MIIIFGTIILIVLVIFVILAINKQIDYKIPILFMFFVLVSAPFVHLDKNIIQLEKFTNYKIINPSKRHERARNVKNNKIIKKDESSEDERPIKKVKDVKKTK